jgi:hypothetical protein
LVAYCLEPYRRVFRGVGLGRDAWPCCSPSIAGFTPGRPYGPYVGRKKRGVAFGVSWGVGTNVSVLSVVVVAVVV